MRWLVLKDNNSDTMVFIYKSTKYRQTEYEHAIHKYLVSLEVS